MTVNSTPTQPVIQPSGNDLCVFGFGANYSFQWKYNGSDYGTNSSCITPLQNGRYIVIVTDTATQCQAVAEPFILTGETMYSDSHLFSVYPNPNQGIFAVETNSKITERVLIKVFDVTGRIVYERADSGNGKLEIDLRGQAKGIYFLRVNSGKSAFSEKLVIE